MSTIKQLPIRGAQGLDLACPEQSPASRIAIFGAVISRTARALANRMAANDLRDLDDRMLDDIGLTRSDLERALTQAGPFDDPTAGLARAARARAWRRFSLVRD